MRTAFEAWAQRDGHIVRRREDKPDEYLVYETQRRWMIWQAALSHGATTAEEVTAKFTKQEIKPEAPRVNPLSEVIMRERILDEALAALRAVDDSEGLAGARRAIEALKKQKQRAFA
ncbi:MAG TPA: hypothetical protein VNT33_15535 [Telluria sp.]|nr:hypothetical protein [Telluria sp.]